MKGRIFDIKKFAIHDGPGIRTTLFLKGCPLNCIWCHNPEGISSSMNLWFFNSKCIGCGSCIEACPENALSRGKPGESSIIIDYQKCNNCGICTEICPTKALSFDGWEIDVDEAVKELLQDRLFYEKSGGGITLSGGDPMLQHEFSKAVLKKCKDAGVQTAIETSMYAKEEIFESFFGLVDLFIVDLKIFNDEKHREYTGTGNQLIHSNFKKLIETKQNMLVRIPLIPEITTTADNLKAIGSFVYNLSPETEIELINFNPLAENKYRLMGKEHEYLTVMKPYTEDELDGFYAILSEQGIKTKRETNVSMIETAIETTKGEY